MKIYIATRFGRRKHATEVAASLHQLGHEVVSKWVWGDSTQDWRELAIADVGQLSEAEGCLVLSEGCERVRGGMWFEMGYALGQGKRVFLLGPVVHVFCEHPTVTRIDSLDQITATK